MKINKLFFSIIILACIISLGNSGSHPISGTSGYTGAPGDSTCGQCHTGSNSSLNGSISITGLPSTIITNTKYTLNVKVANPNGAASKAGFQMLALTGSNLNAGTLSNQSSSTIIKTVSGGKTYFGHSPALNFPISNELNYTVDWTSPATIGSNPIIKFYASSVIANGNGNNNQDLVVFQAFTLPIIVATTPLSVNLSDIINVTCFDGNNGAAKANPTGGTPPYQFLWNNGSTSSNPTNLGAGVAIVTVTDMDNNNATAMANITEPTALISAGFATNTCFGKNNGSVGVFTNGGTPPYLFKWSNNSTLDVQENLGVGAYKVTITDSNGCTNMQSMEIIQFDDIIVQGTTTNIACNGTNNGAIELTVSGGTEPYTFKWQDGVISQSRSNIGPGNYSVIVSDKNGCSSSAAYTISQNPALTTSTVDKKNVTCFDGSDGAVTISIAGGVPPYTTSWSNGAITFGSTVTQTSLPAGSYMLTIVDFYDCPMFDTIQITQPPLISVVADSIKNVTCYDANDGYIGLNTTGSIGSISYVWNNGSTAATLSQLPPSIYTVTATDNSNGCSAVSSFTILTPSPLQLSTHISQEITCFNGANGQVYASVDGGTSGYFYKWNSGEVTDTIYNKRSGTYSVTVADKNGCTVSSSLVLSNPAQIIIKEISNTPASCNSVNNGEIKVDGSEGIAPYIYQWSNGVDSALNILLFPMDYIVTVSDSNGCSMSASFTVATKTPFTIMLDSISQLNCYGDSTGYISTLDIDSYTYLWSNGDTLSNSQGLKAGTYSVIAKDSLSCESAPLTVTIQEPAKIEIQILQIDSLLCVDELYGQVSLNISGGSGALDFIWNTGDSLLVLDTLPVGSYTFQVEDQNKCKDNFAFDIKHTSPIIIDSTVIKDASCYGYNDGSVTIFASGGYIDLTYFWDGIENSAVYDNIPSGDYQLTIKDINNCSVKDTFTVQAPDSLKVNINIINESESGLNDGQIMTSIVGGTPPYTIYWDNNSNDLNQNNLKPGVYNYTVVDSNFCAKSGWAIVGGGPCNLSFTYFTSPSTCFNTRDGGISLDIDGQFKQYDVQIYIGNLRINYALDSLISGNYTVIVGDSTGCISIKQNVEIASIHAPIVIDTIIFNKPTAAQSGNGSITISASGGEGTLHYQWYKNGIKSDTTTIFSNLNAGLYTVEITDSVGCILRLNNIILDIASSTDDSYFSSKLLIYPNPISYDLHIENQNNAPITEIQIFSALGKLIYTDSKKMEKSWYNNIESLGINNNGIYIMRLKIGNKWVSKKIMVHL